MTDDELTDVERRFKLRIAEQCQLRVDAARVEKDATRSIAALCVDARNAGVTMQKLADFTFLLDPKTDEIRSVSRQAIDQLVAAHEGRERAPRRPRRRRTAEPTTGPTKINAEVFGV